MRAKIATLSVTGIVLFFFALAGSASAAEPYGVWLRPSTGSQVHFYNCGGKLCGKVVAVKDQSRKGEIGKFVMRGGVKSGADSWKGTLIDVGTGKSYSGTITAESASALSVQACVAAILCQTESWPRVK
jgi:uncharacterized protein (DUF2147 family)